jgi:hypothetical protein
VGQALDGEQSTTPPCSAASVRNTLQSNLWNLGLIGKNNRREHNAAEAVCAEYSVACLGKETTTKPDQI